MLGDIGVKAGYSHDDSDHALRLPLAQLNADKTKYFAENVLVLVRDPRDTAVSGFFQVTRRLWRSDRPLSDVLCDDRHGIRKVCHFNLQWFAAAPRIQRFAILSYEQMKQAPVEALVAVAARAGVTLDREAARHVAANREFSRMQAAEANGELAARYGNLMLPGDHNDRESFKVRRGVVGGYTDYLSDSDIAFCDAVFSETDYWANHNQALARWGLPGFPSAVPAGGRSTNSICESQPPR